MTQRLHLPLILSPNLGCPVVLAPEELEAAGFEVVLAEEKPAPEPRLLSAKPSFAFEGKGFTLKIEEGEILEADTLPQAFSRVEESRFLISTVLRSLIFADQACFTRYKARLSTPLGEDVLRRHQGQPLATLYDLTLEQGGGRGHTVFHALCLRPPRPGLRFIHMTDLHIALRNDLYAQNLRDTVSYPKGGGPPRYNNFNENLRRFIRCANELAERGELDFVLALGDLVDFFRKGFESRPACPYSNFEVFRGIILGSEAERRRTPPNPGLKVPLFTSTGNHDWRYYPYDPALKHEVWNIQPATAKQLDLFWAAQQEEISGVIEGVYQRLSSEGSPISNKTRLGWLINVVLRRLQKWQVQLLTPLTASVIAGFLSGIPAIGPRLAALLGPQYAILTGVIVLAVVPILMGVLSGLIRWFVRRRITDLLAIDAGWPALKEYFLTLNPFFNYAFRLGGHYFLILDAGHDCLRAQYLWDDGDKKMGPVSIRSNVIGGSPDTMAFYDINEYYPYSQISWLDGMLRLISREAAPSSRVIIGLHAPPANLSRREREKARRLGAGIPGGALLPEGKFNIRYGTINHYVSQFLHLCLGRIEAEAGARRYRPADLVLSGHAHWKLEFRLAWDDEGKNPAVYCGEFTGDRGRPGQGLEQSGPFLLQTPPLGPREKVSPEPPYFRALEIDGQGQITAARVLALREDGTSYPPIFPL